MDLSLGRIQRLLQALQAPHLRYPVVHVAGTNGKGSVTAFVSAVLSREHTPSPTRVGRFNSPFLLHPADSVRIGGRPVPRAAFDRAAAKVRDADAAIGAGCTEFELLASTAFECFADERVDVAVVEVGLGGRLDATNVVDPLVSVITAIGMDHMAQLGNTVELIAGEKAGIIKPGKPVVLGPQFFGGQKVVDVVLEAAKKVGAEEVIQVQDLPVWPVEFTMPLPGDVQLENVATAIKALEVVHCHGLASSDSRLQLTAEDVVLGISRTRWPGRLEWIDHPEIGVVLVDGAHNEQACEALRGYVDEVLDERAAQSGGQADGRVVWVMGVTQGKDLGAILGTLLRPHDMLLSAPFATPEGMPWVKYTPPAEITLAAKMVSPTLRGTAYEDLDACLRAMATFKQNRPLCVLCGSLYLVADVYRRLGIAA
ncbi:Mur ligase [Hyaloraphidium curvatum]|nr:Mur ligase [Hyaloraphidium curvatum]